MLWPAKPWGQWLGQDPLQSIPLVSGLETTTPLVKTVERDVQQWETPLLGAETGRAQLYKSVDITPLLGLAQELCPGHQPFPLYTCPELLPPAHPIFLPTSGHSGAPSAAVGQEKGRTHHVRLHSP